MVFGRILRQFGAFFFKFPPAPRGPLRGSYTPGARERNTPSSPRCASGNRRRSDPTYPALWLQAPPWEFNACQHPRRLHLRRLRRIIIPAGVLRVTRYEHELRLGLSLQQHFSLLHDTIGVKHTPGSGRGGRPETAGLTKRRWTACLSFTPHHMLTQERRKLLEKKKKDELFRRFFSSTISRLRYLFFYLTSIQKGKSSTLERLGNL